MLDDLHLEPFYSYGYKGKSMLAVRAPFATSATDLIGRIARVEGRRFEILSVARMASGPIARGEPIGVELRAAESP